MKAQKPLKDLPGFEEAIRHVRSCQPDISESILATASRAIIPGLNKCCMSAFSAISISLYLQTLKRGRVRLRIVPPPRPVAANDCGVAQ